MARFYMLTRNLGSYICFAQSSNRYHSRMVLHKVRTLSWLPSWNSYLAQSHSRICCSDIFSVITAIVLDRDFDFLSAVLH